MVCLVEGLLIGPDLLSDLDGTAGKDVSADGTEIRDDLSCLRVGDEEGDESSEVGGGC